MMENERRPRAVARSVSVSVSVEEAGIADIPAIMSIERRPGYRALVGSYEAAEHLRRMEAPTCTYLLGKYDGLLGKGAGLSGRRDGDLAGFAVIRRDDDAMGTAQLHRIAVSQPGHGHGSVFLRGICRWVFADGTIDRLWLDLLPSNARAAALYGRLGFVAEGLMRSALRTADGRHDLALMALLRKDWESLDVAD